VPGDLKVHVGSKHRKNSSPESMWETKETLEGIPVVVPAQPRACVKAPGMSKHLAAHRHNARHSCFVIGMAFLVRTEL
jgi:hypothetical protein